MIKCLILKKCIALKQWYASFTNLFWNNFKRVVAKIVQSFHICSTKFPLILTSYIPIVHLFKIWAFFVVGLRMFSSLPVLYTLDINGTLSQEVTKKMSPGMAKMSQRTTETIVLEVLFVLQQCSWLNLGYFLLEAMYQISFFCIWISNHFSAIYWKDYTCQLNCLCAFVKFSFSPHHLMVNPLSQCNLEGISIPYIWRHYSDCFTLANKEVRMKGKFMSIRY